MGDREIIEVPGYHGPDRRRVERRACPFDGCHKPQAAAENAADAAIEKVFAVLGIDVHNPKEVEQFRQGLRFGEAMHRYAERGMMTLVGVIAAGLAVAAAWGLAIKVAHIAAKAKGGQ